MKVKSTPGGRYKESLYFTAQEIDQICLDALKSVELLPEVPQPIRVERFIEKRFGCQIVYENFQEGVMGCTLFENNGSVKIVMISSSLDNGTESGSRRARSTLAHEGGHCLMHQILFIENDSQLFLTGTNDNIDINGRRIMCREGDISETPGQYNGKWWEYQANRAIGGLLLPVKLVRDCVQPLLSSTGKLGILSLASEKKEEAKRLVAKTFDVNPIVSDIRLAEIFTESSQPSL